MTKRKRMIALILVLIFLLIYFCQFQSSKTSFDRDKQKNIIHRNYANMGCWLFKERIQDWKKIWLKINIPKVNHCILWTNVVESCQRVQKSDFQSQLFMSKIMQTFLKKNSFKNIFLEAHFLLLLLFDNFNF